MIRTFFFDSATLQSMAGGQSVLDTPKLNIQTLEAASSFLKTYGFDLQIHHDVEKLWYYHRRAMVLMQENLKIDIAEIPSLLTERKNLQDLRHLLLFASLQGNTWKECTSEFLKSRLDFHIFATADLQKWSCAILRCMHVFVHSENDLFAFFSEKIQQQILSSFENVIIHDGAQHQIQLKNWQNPEDPIHLVKFEVKPFKTSSSTVIKLLAKPDALAMKIFDKIGVRFVTKNIYDSFRVLQTLVDQNVISFPHIMPDQSSNNIYPVDLFVRIYQTYKTQPLSATEFEQILHNELVKEDKVSFLRKENHFSGGDYKFIKFISRQLIRIQLESGQTFSFFYPFEVQILDSQAYEQILSGPSEHQAYKERQRIAARKRLLG